MSDHGLLSTETSFFGINVSLLFTFGWCPLHLPLNFLVKGFQIGYNIFIVLLSRSPIRSPKTLDYILKVPKGIFLCIYTK